jgi:WhiB family transcriptional regulator, redox-sensing transcriptional regulator
MTTSRSMELIGMTPTIRNAPCQSTDSETFFPDPTEIEKIALAKSFCATCLPSVKSACLSFALENRIRYGVWGGLTESERHNLQRRESRRK